MDKKQKTNSLLFIYFLLAFANLLSVFYANQVGIYLSKPLLLCALAIWFYQKTKEKSKNFERLILYGLILSNVGDIILMFSGISDLYFIFGLLSFLIAHIFYISAFIKYPRLENGLIFKNPLLSLLALTYLAFMIYYLWPDINDALKVPVLVYSTIISIMLVSGINMSGRVGSLASVPIIIGAILFVLSDSIIAVKKFKELIIPDNFLGVVIMATYLTGQFLIAKGSANVQNYYDD